VTALGLGSVLSDLRRDGSVGLLLSVSLGWFLTLGIRIVYPALLPAITDEFGVGTATAGLFIAALWVTYALLQFPGGVLGDAVGERLVLVASVSLTMVAVSAIVLSTTLALFVAATVLLGVGTGLFGTTRLTVVAATFDRMETTAISVSQAAGNVGNVVLTATAGLVSVYAGWRWGFGYVLPAMAVAGVALWIFVPRRASATTDGASFRSTMKSVVAAIRRPRVLAVTVLLSANMFLYQSVTGFLPTYLVIQKGLEPGTAAALYSFFYVAAIAVQFLSGVVADRRGNRPAIVGFLALSVPGFVLLTIAVSIPAIVVAVVLVSGVLGALPPVNAVGVGALPEAIRGSGFGLLRTFYMVVGAAGPPLVGLFGEAGRFDLAFLLLGVLALATAVWGLSFQRIGQPA
jgi:MFS family permease